MQKSKDLARASWKGSGDKSIDEKWFKIREQLNPTEFLGYEFDKAEGVVLKISKDFGVMADVVINHGSSKGKWFNNFIKGKGKGHDYFLNFDEKFDVSKVVRPRTSDLLNSFDTSDAEYFDGYVKTGGQRLLTVLGYLRDILIAIFLGTTIYADAFFVRRDGNLPLDAPDFVS